MSRTLRASALACAMLCGAFAAASGQAVEQREIDPAKSSAVFKIAHIFVSHVSGSIPIVSGDVSLVPGTTIPTAVSAVLDPARVDTGDHDRDASLKSSDYFDVAKFPTWTFVSSKIVASGSAAFGVDGTLTVHGVAQPEHLDVTVSGDAEHPLYHATARIDRHAFGMKGTRLDPVIGAIAAVDLVIALK